MKAEYIDELSRHLDRSVGMTGRRIIREIQSALHAEMVELAVQRGVLEVVTDNLGTEPNEILRFYRSAVPELVNGSHLWHGLTVHAFGDNATWNLIYDMESDGIGGYWIGLNNDDEITYTQIRSLLGFWRLIADV